MAKKRVHEIAKAQGLTSKELLATLKAAGVEAKAAQSSVEESDALAALKDSGDGGGTATATKTKAAAGQGPAAEDRPRTPRRRRTAPEGRAAKPAGGRRVHGASARQEGPAPRSAAAS